MKLYLHIGTEKTGSSFLQKISGTSRRFLLQNGIFFPSAGRDERLLLNSTISPGNARELSELIAAAKWTAVSRWLGARVRAAKIKGCGRLLLSNELLFAALSRGDSVSHFETAARQAGVKILQALLMIRDPADQAISLFKHRAKNGAIPQIGHWIRTDYSLPEEVICFLNQIENSEIQLHLRKYVKNTESILKIFFSDWLGVERPRGPAIRIVNPSLTFSELEVIRHLALIRPAMVPLFYAKMVAIPLDKKAAEIYLDRAARVEVDKYLCQFDELWKELNSRLRADGGILIPTPNMTPAITPDGFHFSETQIRAWAEVHDESLQVRYRIVSWLDRHFRPRLGRLKRKIGVLFKGGIA